MSFDCSSDDACTKAGGQCETFLDGYDIQVLVGAVIGVLYIFVLRRWVADVHAIPLVDWRLKPSPIH